MNHTTEQIVSDKTEGIGAMSKLNNLLLLIFILIGFFNTATASDRVLVVHSYHQGFTWVDKISAVIELKLKSYGIVYRTFHMDTKRRSSESWKVKAGLEAKKMMTEFAPKVVITVDDNAQNYFAKDYAGKSQIQFVFCGVNADPAKYGYPAHNVTGILERSYPVQTLHTLKTIMPQVQRVAVVGDDSASTDMIIPRIQSIVDKGLRGRGIAVSRYIRPTRYAQWQQTIRDLESDDGIDALLIPTYHTVKKDGGKISVDSQTVMRWTLQHTQKPVVGLWTHLVQDGGLLAVTVDPVEHGRWVAQTAIKIIEGQPAGAFPIRENQNGYVMVNLKDKNHLALDASLDIEQVADLVIR